MTAGFRLTIEQGSRAGSGSPNRQTLSLVTRADLDVALSVVKDAIGRAKANVDCRAITIVLHLPDCDHEP